MKITVTVDKNTTGNYEVTKCEKILVELMDYGDVAAYGGPDINIRLISEEGQTPRQAEVRLHRDDAVKLAHHILSAAVSKREIGEFYSS